MGMMRAAAYAAALAFALAQGGCAAPVHLPEGTLVLYEIVQVHTRQEILTGPMYLGMLARGMQSGDMVDGSAATGRTQYSWQEPEPGSVREVGSFLLVARGLEVRPGNVVEAQRGYYAAMVLRVIYPTLADGKCVYATDDGEVTATDLAGLRPAGKKRAASLRCAGLAAEGWSAAKRCDGIEWTKPPPPDHRPAFYGESRALHGVAFAILAPFAPCHVLTQ
jgi:hypothetical protein